MTITTPDLEIRTAALAVELREGGAGIGQLTGYAAVFNRYSQNLGGFVEQVDPGAFTKSLQDGNPVMARGNHNDAYLLGTTWAGTLTLEVDGTGLRYTVDLPDTGAGRDYKALAARGDIRWSSFAFRTAQGGDDWGLTDQGFPLRTLRAVQLVDVAPVNSPAYLDTSVGLRSLAAHTTDSEAPAASVLEADGQRATHPTLSLRRMLLDLDAQR